MRDSNGERIDPQADLVDAEGCARNALAMTDEQLIKSLSLLRPGERRLVVAALARLGVEVR